jgi:sporadic carbohydrate cluster protein (TIGR04323 family)
MKQNKIFAGYIFLKSINGILFPSYIQNKMNKEFIENTLKGKLYMSQNENMYSKRSIVLHSLISENNKINGIVMPSVFYLPEQKKERLTIYKNLIIKKKSIFFILEKLSFLEKKDVQKIEESLIFTESFFTKQINNLTSYEKKFFIDNKWSFI